MMNEIQARTDVLICGAGPAGLSLAIELARRRVAFLLIDKAAGPFQGSRGKGIQPRTHEIFEDFGVLDRVMAAGGLPPALRTYRKDNSFNEAARAPIAADPAEPYPLPLVVAQFRTEAVLRERLAELGHHPRYKHELVDFSQSSPAVTATINGPDGIINVSAAYLVGVDGGSSVVRHRLDIDFPGEALGVRAVVADVRLDGLGRDAWHRWPNGIGVCPLPGTDLFQIQGMLKPDTEVDPSLAGLTALLTAASGRTGITVTSVSWASVYSMSARVADRYRAGRVLLAGDAAHVHPPTGGQGLNTSIQDAYNLGWKLTAVLAGAPDRLLDTYEQERRPIAAEMITMATRLLLAPAAGVPQRGREVHQLDLGYRDSTLSLNTPESLNAAGRATDGRQPGDRAPDAPLLGAAGQPTRLFTLLRGPHWTLLGYQAHPDVTARAGLHIHTVGPDGDLIDNNNHLQQTYGLTPGDQVLIRPDGYLAALLPAAHADLLPGYLSEVGLTPDHP
jgi:2-polyprenyl-6-methoxyphenol hydroxylase-like FAD-dependent oxidoreductase